MHLFLIHLSLPGATGDPNSNYPIEPCIQTGGVPLCHITDSTDFHFITVRIRLFLYLWFVAVKEGVVEGEQ